MSRYVPLYLDLTDHPKFKKLRRRLPASIPATQGHLAGVWRFAWKYALADGDLSAFDNADIAEAACWEDDPDHFCNAMAEARFLDRTPNGGFAVHDWDEYTGEYRARKENGDKGRHTRYHTQRGVFVPGCHWCEAGVATGVATDNRTELTLTELKESFERFWNLYPKNAKGKRLEKKQALDQWKKLDPDERERAETGAKFYCEDRDNEGGAYVKSAFRWLKHKSFEDWQEPSVDSNPQQAVDPKHLGESTEGYDPALAGRGAK